MSLKSTTQSLEKEIYLICFQNSELAKHTYLMRRSTLKIGRGLVEDVDVLAITNFLRVARHGATQKQKSHSYSPLLRRAASQKIETERAVGVSAKCEWLVQAPLPGRDSPRFVSTTRILVKHFSMLRARLAKNQHRTTPSRE
jgi:hypothetical protein